MILSLEYLPAGTASGLSKCLVVIINALLLLCRKSHKKVSMIIGSLLCLFGLFLMTQPPSLFDNLGFPERRYVNWTSPCIIPDVEEKDLTEHLSFMWLYETNITLDSVNPLNASSKIIKSYNKPIVDFHSSVITNVMLSTSMIGFLLCLGDAVCFVGYTNSLCYLVDEITTATFFFWNPILGFILSLTILFSFENVSIPSSPFCWFLLFCHCIGTVTLVVPWCVKYISPNICNLVICSILC